MSLLAGMSAKERQKLRSKGIFTVTQLSYTFRPRRRPKRLRDKREKYHHALKALAIREQKIHIVGSPELKLEGTPVYLDVEGLPDRDFFYLIGVRIGHGDSAVQHSLWADTVADEGKIWREFLALLETVEKPILIHYGTFESNFVARMTQRYGSVREGAMQGKPIANSINLLAWIYAQIYFSTYSNSLKEIGNFLNFKWAEPCPAGTQSIVLRSEWQQSCAPQIKQYLVRYNSDDCMALELLATSLRAICLKIEAGEQFDSDGFVRAENLRTSLPYRLTKIEFVTPEFDYINKASYWDYQRNRIYVRTNPRLRRSSNRKFRQIFCADKVVDLEGLLECPKCGFKPLKKNGYRKKLVVDLCFQRRGIARRVELFRAFNYRCGHCGMKIPAEISCLPKDRYGPGFVTFLLYQMTELVTPQVAILKLLNGLFHLDIANSGNLAKVISKAAEYYKNTYNNSVKRLTSGELLHVDETMAVVKGMRGYVWVFTNMEEVAYIYSGNREGQLLKDQVGDFKGVLISDFYSAYDAINCPQQKCLVHLLRDFNDDLLLEPFNKELKHIALGFGELLKSIVETIDRFGLKARFLNKHHTEVKRYFSAILGAKFETNTAVGYRKRFEKYQHKLFTFLDYDGVPWNNNNAECAVKAFVRLRNVLRGASTEKVFKTIWLF